MATHESVVVPASGAKALADVDTGIGTIAGVTKNGNLGADGVSGGSTTNPLMDLAGVDVTIDDATFVDPADGSMGTEEIHTGHYPGTRTDFDREG